ncbi:hypothetical protein ACVA51_13695 [Pseudomonas luteola]
MFALDTNAARAADNKSAFIDEAGKYIGAFTRAEYMEKKETGSTGIGLTYKTREGAEGQFYVNLTYQHGTRNEGGYQLINALMACMQLRNVGNPQPIIVEKWDKDAGQRVKATVQGFPEMMGKPVGLLIQMEIEKTSTSGQPRPTIYAPFSAESEKTSSEVLDANCREPAKLEKMVQQVMKKPVIDRRPKDAQMPATQNYSGNHIPEDDYSDIPF